jgi:hypothetical protein
MALFAGPEATPIAFLKTYWPAAQRSLQLLALMLHFFEAVSLPKYATTMAANY